MKKAIIKLEKVHKSYYKKRIFTNVNLTIGQEVYAIIGANGSGKSTLLRMLAGFESCTKGKIRIASNKKGYFYPKDPSQMAYFKMAYAGQDDNFLPNLTVKQNIILGNEPLVAKIFPNWKAAELQINALMKKYKIKLSLHKKVATLAIEELKKLSLLRALFKEPQILLLDEPTVGLSASQKMEFWMIFKTFRHEAITVLFTTRDEEFAKAVANQVSWISNYNITPPQKTVLSSQGKLFISDYWSTICRYDKVPATNDIPLLYISNLSQINPHLSNFNNLELAIRRKEIYGIYDYENLYSEVLINSIIGINKTKTGRLFFDSKEITFFSPQEISNCGIDWVLGQYLNNTVISDGTLFENFTFWHYNKTKYVSKSGVIKTAIVNKKVREIIKEYEIFTNNDLHIKINQLSKGELQKFVLARSIEEQPKLLILSNPFADLDQKAALLIIKKLLALIAKGSSILLIDSDPYLLQLLCQRVAVIYHKHFVCKLIDDEITVNNMNSPSQWEKYPLINEIIIKDDSMYQLPLTRWQVLYQKSKKWISYLTIPFVKLHHWLKAKLTALKLRWE